MRISFELNGQPQSLEAEPGETVLDLLRNRLAITSPKRGCDRGECGACTVLIDGMSINACLSFAPVVSGRKVETIEGLGSPGQPSPLQRLFHEMGAAQCGFCTPGMVLSAEALLRQKKMPERDEIAAAIAGNICRCTGYIKIIEAIEAVSKRGDATASAIGKSDA